MNNQNIATSRACYVKLLKQLVLNRKHSIDRAVCAALSASFSNGSILTHIPNNTDADRFVESEQRMMIGRNKHCEVLSVT